MAILANPVSAEDVRVEVSSKVDFVTPLADIVIDITAENRGGTYVELDKFRIKMHPSLERLRRGNSAGEWSKFPDHELRPGETETVTVTIPSAFSLEAVTSSHAIFFRSGVYYIGAEVRYRTTEDNPVEVGEEGKISVPFEVPLPVLIIGSLVGALLVELTRQLWELEASRKRGSIRTALLGQILSLMIRLPLGLLMAIIAIILARVTTEFAGVFSFRIVDVWGGVLVGMFAQWQGGPFGSKLGQLLGHGAPDKQESQGSENKPREAED